MAGGAPREQWTPATGTPFLSAAELEQFERDGLLAIEGFASEATCAALRAAIAGITEQFRPEEHPTSVFSTVKQTSDDYFLESGDKVRYFFEGDAFDAEGNLLGSDLGLSLNKIGHALHELDGTFKAFTHLPAFKDIARALGYKDPVVAQSMYIFKQPRVGGLVATHQDRTFLYTDPQSTLGFWIPLKDCTLENGCLQGVLGSHRSGLDNGRRMVRAEGGGTVFTGDLKEYPDAAFTPLETKAGSLVLIHGDVVHRSATNKSKHPRPAYTFHCIENSDSEGNHQYDARNWLQPSAKLPFPPL